MDLLRPIYQFINLLEFENAFAGILAILKSEKRFLKTEVSDITEIYFKIPKDLKIRQCEQIKNSLKIFFKYQIETLTLTQKRKILEDYFQIDKNDIWSRQEFIATCLKLGDIEVARKTLKQLLEESLAYKRIRLIENLCKQFNDLLDESELFHIEFICAALRHDAAGLKQLYTRSLKDNKKRLIFQRDFEESNDAKSIAPEDLMIDELQRQLNRKLNASLKKKIVNELYEFLAISSKKKNIMLMCADYFIKAKRKKVAQRILEIVKESGGHEQAVEQLIKSLEEKSDKMKEDKEFSLEKDEIFDLAEDLFSDSINDHIKSRKKHSYILDMSLMDKDSYLIRQGLLSIDEISNKELQKQPVQTRGEDKKLEKELENALRELDEKIKIELHKDLVSALIMLEMPTVALKLCEELIPLLPGIEHRISIHYLIALINFKKEKYDRVIELSDAAVASLPLSFADKIAFLKLMSTAFQKKGDIKNSISVKKLIDELGHKHDEVSD